MAKKIAEVNKSAEIRTYMKQNPKAKPRDVVQALKDKGINVSAQFVSTVKTNSKKGTGTKRRGRPVGSGKKTTVTRRSVSTTKSADQISVGSLLKLKDVIKEIGSIEETKAALATLEQLAK